MSATKDACKSPSIPFFQRGKVMRPFALCAFVIATLAACTVGPNYVRPTAEVTNGYKELDGWKVAQPNDDTLRGSWWEMFNEPDLNALESQVDVSNQTIAAAEATYRQAVALVQEARS